MSSTQHFFTCPHCGHEIDPFQAQGDALACPKCGAPLKGASQARQTLKTEVYFKVLGTVVVGLLVLIAVGNGVINGCGSCHGLGYGAVLMACDEMCKAKAECGVEDYADECENSSCNREQLQKYLSKAGYRCKQAVARHYGCRAGEVKKNCEESYSSCNAEFDTVLDACGQE